MIKIDKQQIAVIGLMGVVAIFLVIYCIVMFGGSKEKTHKDEFKAPTLVKNESKDDYNQRLQKKLREEPQKPKDTIIVNPFESTENTPKEEIIKQEEETTAPVRTKAPAEKKSSSSPNLSNIKNDILPRAETIKKAKEEAQQMLSDVKPDDDQKTDVRTKARYGQSKENNSAKSNETYQASVYGQQKIYSGSLLKMRLLSPLTVSDNVTIPRNTFIAGTVSFSTDRVNVKITAIAYDNVIYKVNLTIYDANDGLPGIYIEGGVLNDVNDQAGTDVTTGVLSYNRSSIVKGIGQEVKKWTQKKSVTVLNEHKLFLK